MKQNSSEEYPIDKNVPAPYTVSIPLDDLEPGESILFPLDRRSSVQSLASRHKRLKGKEYIVRKTSETEARVWRTK